MPAGIESSTAVRIPWARPLLFGDEKAYAADALESTMLSGGPYVDRLEGEFAAIHGVEAGHAISVSNGTTALYLALLGLGIGRGDQVIVPAWCFAAAANMVLACGATPVFADVQADTWLLDPEAVAKAITPRTRAIVAVHTYGVVCEMERLMALAQARSIAVIEDCAEALFSRRNGRPVGMLGDIGCFSFQATKTITCGEGGLVLARDAQLAAAMRLIRNHGMRAERKYWHEVVGHNFRLTNLQAAVACAQLGHREEIVALRERVYRGYRERLADARGLEPQFVPAAVQPVMWACAVRLEAGLPVKRDEVIEKLARSGIETRPGFHAFSEQPLYAVARAVHAELIAPKVISLPSIPNLADAELDGICEALIEAVAS